MRIKIRKANSKDLETLVDFMIAMAKETEGLSLQQNVLKPGVEAALNDEQKGIYYIAEIDDKIAGSLMITFEWSDWRNKWVLWVQSVYTHPDFRKRGVYNALYQHLVAKVEAGEYAGIRLYVDKTNLPAQKVYQKLGMDGSHYDFYEWMR